MKPDEIVALFRVHWSGTEEELEQAIEAFYNDIRSSYGLTFKSLTRVGVSTRTIKEIHDTVAGYFYNHYV